MTIAFRSFELRPGTLQEFPDALHPTLVTAWLRDARDLAADGTHFGFVHEGPATLDCAAGQFSLRSGMYFAVPGPLRIEFGTGLVVTARGYGGFFQIGGPIESIGRLRYIDGCTDSLLIPPVLRGDPCLNLLHLPPHTRQSPHTHPSLRIGLVVRGAGHCVTHEGHTALLPGRAFVIAADQTHCFHTDDQPLVVVAYHPDSDFGPTHEDHPMINRTIVEGM